MIFTEKSFFYTIQGFTQSHSGELGDIEGFVQMIIGSYKSYKPVNITGIDKNHLKCDCLGGSIVNGVREPVLYSSTSEKPPGHKTHHTAKIQLFKKIK